MITLTSKSFVLGKEIIEKIEQANYQAYFVGGCVRDKLLKRSIGDIDIATSAKPHDIMRLFEQVIPIGIEHGTVLVRHKKHSFEITTFRLDGDYSDKRHPDTVEYIDRIEEDLKRRDFTINALAMDRSGEIIDLFQGEKHLQQRLIQTVGDGYERFTEDPLRIIRALRFSSQLGFDIDPKTLIEMEKVKSDIDQLAIERITNEMTKFFAGSYVQKGIDYLLETKIYEHLPIFKDHPNIIDLLPQKKEPLHSFSEVIATFCLLKTEISILDWIHEWKGSNKVKREATELFLALQYYEQHGLDQLLVFELPSHLYDSFIRVCQYVFPDEITKKELLQIDGQLPIHTEKDLQISGKDLIQLYPNIKQGPWIRNMLHELKKHVLFSNLNNNKPELKEWAKCNPPGAN